MIELVPSGSGTVSGAIASVERQLPQECRAAIRRLYIDDGSRRWLGDAVSRPVDERRRSVIAALGFDTLVAAARMEIGGAFRLPVSTRSMIAACEAVLEIGGRQARSTANSGAISTLTDGADRVHAVGWPRIDLWRRLTSDHRMVERLSGIAGRLDRLTALVDPPTLVVVGGAPTEIARACATDESSTADPLLDRPTIVDVSETTGCEEPRVAMATALARAGDERDPAVAGGVFELPDGRKVGRWAADPVERSPAEGWTATPMGVGRNGLLWRCAVPGGEVRTFDEVVSVDESGSDDASVLRLPGWLTADLRPGSPAGLLVETMAGDPARQDRPLWLPNVDADGVRFAQTLGGPVWVDGPGVPD